MKTVINSYEYVNNLKLIVVPVHIRKDSLILTYGLYNQSKDDKYNKCLALCRTMRFMYSHLRNSQLHIQIIYRFMLIYMVIINDMDKELRKSKKSNYYMHFYLLMFITVILNTTVTTMAIMLTRVNIIDMIYRRFL